MAADKRRIAIYVDIRQRDLPAYAVLQELLRRRSYEVVLFPPSQVRSLTYAFKPHLVVLPNANHPALIRWAYHLKSRGTLVAFIPTEGVPSVLDQDFLEYMAGRFTDLRPIDLYLVWNEAISGLAVQNGYLPSDRVKVVGVPRFDFYHASFAPLRASRQELCARYGLDPARPTVLWTTNFAAPSIRTDEFKREMELVGLKQVRLLGDASQFRDNEVRTRELIAQAVIAWVERHPEVNVMIRPHPNERREYYTEIIARLRPRTRHMALCTAEPIWDVLSAADLLLQRCCTTGVEGAAMGLPVLELRLNPDEMLVNADRDTAMDVVESAEEMSECMDRYLAGEAVPDHQVAARTTFIERWFARIDGRRTADCAEALAALVESAPDQQPLYTSLEQSAARVALGLRSLQGKTGLQRKHPLRSPDTFITTADVEQWQRRIRQTGLVDNLLGAAVA